MAVRFGMLVPVGDPETMAGAIVKTLENPPPADFLRPCGRYVHGRAIRQPVYSPV